MPYSAQDYEFLFTNPSGELTEAAFKALRHKNVFRYRTKTIKSGDILECEIYPIWATQNEIKKAKKAATREAQRNLNEKNAHKYLIRKMNANFTAEDLCLTLTYKGPIQPDEHQARRDIRNNLRRVRDFRKKHGMTELKYVYVIEFTGEGGRKKKRIHHHVVMSGMDRDEAEKIWGKGWANSRRLQPDEYGLEAITRYMVKEPHGKKRWCASRNLVEPTVTTADTKLSKRQAEKLAQNVEEAGPGIFGKLFPGYSFNDCSVRWSDFVGGAYIYTRMHRDKAAKGSKKKSQSKKKGVSL